MAYENKKNKIIDYLNQKMDTWHATSDATMKTTTILFLIREFSFEPT